MNEVHVVQPGECMLTIAELHGYASWRAVYFDSRNSELRSRCPDPFVLEPGQEVFLPPRRPLERRCRTGQRHVFRLPASAPTWTLRLLLENEGGEPSSGTAYRLQVSGEGSARAGVTSSDGWLEEPTMPMGAMWGTLEVWSGESADGPPAGTWTVEFGGLDPATTSNGQAQRLVNLGYLDPADREDPDRIDAALAEFRRDQVVSVDDDEDAEHARLTRVHGS